MDKWENKNCYHCFLKPIVLTHIHNITNKASDSFTLRAKSQARTAEHKLKHKHNNKSDTMGNL